MKTLILILIVLTAGLTADEELTDGLIAHTTPIDVEPNYNLWIENNGKHLEFDFNTDTLKVSGDLEMDAAAEIFIECLIVTHSKYIQDLKAKIDSLKTELLNSTKKTEKQIKGVGK